MSAAVVSRLFASWKVPKLSSVPSGIAAGTPVDGDAVLGWHTAIRDELVDEAGVILNLRAEDTGPERGQGMRVSRVERHLSSHRVLPGRGPARSDGSGCGGVET